MSRAAAIREALQEGRLMEAVDAARDALEAAPGDPEPLYLKALALSRLGAAELAQQVVTQLLARGDLAPALRAEGWALQGRILKDGVFRGGETLVNARALAAARCYEQAHATQAGAFFAVNAATLHRMAGDRAASEALALEALGLLPREPADHWDAATRGECLLLLSADVDAAASYAQAARLAGDRYGDVASMRRQLRLLERRVPEAGGLLRQVPAPLVVAFSGHMIDAPGRRVARFPPSMEGTVRTGIETWLDRQGAVIGYSQAACGSDILFLEAMQARGMRTHIWLPCALRDFLAQSVRFAGSDWEARFQRVMAGATSVGYATAEAYLGDDVLFEHASRLIDGLAILHAQQLQGEATMLVVLDGASVGGAGGTRATLDEWREAGRSAHEIDLALLRGPRASVAASAPVAATPSRSKRDICALVFCDVRGYSRLTEEYSPLFQRRFLGEARLVMDALGPQFRTAQTAGDGIYATFSSVRAAAEFSLQLRDRVAAIDWTEFGMPADTALRVALHCGPAFPLDDPVTGQPNYCGSHVNRTARIEPIVTPGEVFATDVVAAYLALQAPRDYECDYLGVLPLAKGYGSAPLYRLRRAQRP